MSHQERRYRCFTKVSRYEAGPPKRGVNWVLAKRAWFDVYDDHLKIGDVRVEYTDINKAVLYNVRWFFMTAYVMELHFDDKKFQFGFNPWADPAKHMKIEFEHVKARLGYSAFSVVIRILAVLAVAYWVYTRFG